MEKKNLSVYPAYIPGLQNVTADALSRDKVVPTEWALSPHSFQDLVRKIGWIPEVDLMATPENTKLHAFVSPFPVSSAVATDFFSINLGKWNKIYIFPPRNLVLRVLTRLLPFRGKVLLIAPYLPSQSWFPILKARAIQCLPLLDPPFQIVQGERILLPSKEFCLLRGWIF